MLPEDDNHQAAQRYGVKKKMISRKVLMSTAIGVAGVAVLSGGVLAATNGHKGGPSDDILNRVAEIVGVDAGELGDALDQARSEVRDERRAERLAQLVADGVITQAEADEITAWQDARPSVLDDIASQAGPHRGHRGGDGNGDRLAQLVEDGVITQAQADEISAWRDARPEAVDLIRPHRPNGQGHHRGRGRFRGSFEGQFQGRFGGHFRPFDGAPGEDVPGLPGGLQYIVPPTDGNSA